MKFMQFLSSNLVQSLCIEYGWCTRMTDEDFNDMLEIAQTQECELAIQNIAPRIYAYSNTDMNITEIAGELYRNAHGAFGAGAFFNGNPERRHKSYRDCEIKYMLPSV